MAGTGGSPEPGCVVDLNCNPEVLPSSGDFAQDCVDHINQFRVGCHCLPPLQRWTEAEACADANAEYDEGTGQAHSGWPDKACPDQSGPLSRANAGWATNECPGWGSSGQILSGCLKSMYGEGATWAQQLGRAPTQERWRGRRTPVRSELQVSSRHGRVISRAPDKEQLSSPRGEG